MSRIASFIFIASALLSTSAWGAEWLMKLERRASPSQIQNELRMSGHPVLLVEDLRFNGWYLVHTPTESWTVEEAYSIGRKGRAAWVEPNKEIRIAGAPKTLSKKSAGGKSPDPVYNPQSARPSGADPMLSRQWSLNDIGAMNVPHLRGNPRVIVAVIDTGVDYNHPDLNTAIWTNPGESGDKANNGIDDDGNGYIDDYVGWDFVDQDNTPWDRTRWFGNTGHGTHCAGVIAASADNSFGIRGVAPGVRIMPVRFLSEGGSGTTANAVRAVKYALDMGAAILSNSWGGADENNDDSRALREIFAESHRRGRLTIVAAGNSSMDVDRSPDRATPASFGAPNQITVAATGSSGGMAGFSNYGAKLVHLGAPGVGIYSSVTGGGFANMDGTSMATPVVAGAAALFWSLRPDLDHMSVRSAILSTVTPTPALAGRVATGGRLNVENLVKQFSFIR